MRRYMVDGDAVAENARRLRAWAGSKAIYGVLKAEGYGVGLEPMAAALAEQGIDRFALTEPEDVPRLTGSGLPLREILLLTPVTCRETAERLVREPVTFSVGSAEEAALLSRAAKAAGGRARVQVQVDTGLGRYGLPWDEPMHIRWLYTSFPALEVTGIYTHFAGPGTDRAFHRFRRVLEALEAWGIDPGTRHCCSSASALVHQEMHLDGMRIGSAFLGRVRGGEKLGLRPAGICQGEIQAVHTGVPGQRVGYGGRFRCGRGMRLAVVNVGAVHGLSTRPDCGRQSAGAGLRGLLRAAADLWAGRGPAALVKGREAPVVGQVCSECALLDVTDIDCRPGDTAEFFLNPLYLRGMEIQWRRGSPAE